MATPEDNGPAASQVTGDAPAEGWPRAGPPRLGVLVNGRAREVVQRPELAGELERLVGRERVWVTEDLGAVGGALASLRALDVEALVLVGGDGSAGAGLTAMVQAWRGAELPAVLLAGGGTICTIARSLGARGRPERLVERLLEPVRPVRAQPRPLLRLCADGEAPRFGMIFAMGVATRFLEAYYREQATGVLGASALIGRVVASALVGGALARELFEPFGAQIRVDDEALARCDATILAAASVVDLGLGFRPFYTAGRSAERIHLALTDATASRLAAEMPALRLGLHGARSCLRHFSPRHARVLFDTPQAWSLDADLYPPAKWLGISAGPVVRFLSV